MFASRIRMRSPPAARSMAAFSRRTRDARLAMSDASVGSNEQRTQGAGLRVRVSDPDPSHLIPPQRPKW